MLETIVVNELTVRVETGDPEDDPYRQGFAAIFAEIDTDQNDVAVQLKRAELDRCPVTIRCATLEVSGEISKSRNLGSKTRFVLSVENLVFHPPKHPWDGSPTNE